VTGRGGRAHFRPNTCSASALVSPLGAPGETDLLAVDLHVPSLAVRGFVGAGNRDSPWVLFRFSSRLTATAVSGPIAGLIGGHLGQGVREQANHFAQAPTRRWARPSGAAGRRGPGAGGVEAEGSGAMRQRRWGRHATKPRRGRGRGVGRGAAVTKRCKHWPAMFATKSRTRRWRTVQAHEAQAPGEGWGRRHSGGSIVEDRGNPLRCADCCRGPLPFRQRAATEGIDVSGTLSEVERGSRPEVTFSFDLAR
jgi:hypothetical protein